LSFLPETNVVSEWVKPKPAATVVDWLAEVDEDEVFLSAISFAELRRGVQLLGAGRRRSHLERWLTNDLAERFEGRILPSICSWRLRGAASRRGRHAQGARWASWTASSQPPLTPMD
jgi:toxin FitB